MSWGEIKQSINSNLNKPLDTLDNENTSRVLNELSTVKSTVSSTRTDIATLSAAVATSAALASYSPIKNVLRGTAAFNTSAKSITISISTVNPQKCMVLINGSAGSITHSNSVSSYTFSVQPYLSSLSTNTLVIAYGGEVSIDNRLGFGWQIIEFK